MQHRVPLYLKGTQLFLIKRIKVKLSDITLTHLLHMRHHNVKTSVVQIPLQFKTNKLLFNPCTTSCCKLFEMQLTWWFTSVYSFIATVDNCHKSYAGSESPDKTVHLRILTRELHCSLLSQYIPISVKRTVYTIMLDKITCVNAQTDQDLHWH